MNAQRPITAYECGYKDAALGGYDLALADFREMLTIVLQKYGTDTDIISAIGRMPSVARTRIEKLKL